MMIAPLLVLPLLSADLPRATVTAVNLHSEYAGRLGMRISGEVTLQIHDHQAKVKVVPFHSMPNHGKSIAVGDTVLFVAGSTSIRIDDVRSRR